MSINFKRNRTQVEFEKMVGIPSVEDLQSMRDQFKNYTLNNNDAELLKKVNVFDALDYFNNGLISMAEGLDNMCKQHYTWATVKLYYSVFYFLRASMAANGIAIMQNNSMYRLKIAVGEKPYSTKNKKYNSTHGGIISHYKDIFSREDKLMTNTIDNVDPYQWLENVRNIVNYREVCFLDPFCLEIWDSFDEAINNKNIDDLIMTIIKDDVYIYCFQEEYAVIAIPLKRFQQTVFDLKCNGLLKAYQDDRIEYVDSLMPIEIGSFNISSYIRIVKKDI